MRIAKKYRKRVNRSIRKIKNKLKLIQLSYGVKGYPSKFRIHHYRKIILAKSINQLYKTESEEENAI
nr:MAG TPA: hypothetical protein [Caudoviricetes sp.]